VGVIGKGHFPGVVHAMTHHHGDLRFRDLAGSRSALVCAVGVASCVAASELNRVLPVQQACRPSQDLAEGPELSCSLEASRLGTHVVSTSAPN